MGRLIAWSIGTAAVLVGALLLILLLTLLLFDWNRLRGEAAALASDTLGRPVQLQGLDIDPGWTTHIRIRGLQVSNPSWAQADNLFSLERGELALRLWPLLKGELRLPEILLHTPQISLERDAKGRSNWNLAASADTLGETVQPQRRGEFPVIDRLRIEDGRLHYRDVERDMELQGKIASATGDAAGDDALDLRLQGSLQHKPLHLSVHAGSVVKLRETHKPYPLKLDLRFGKTRLQADGTVLNPLRLQGFDMDLSVKGETLAEVFPLFGIPLPDTRPYRLSGALGYRDKAWRFEDFDGRVGQSDLSGTLSYEERDEKPYVQARLVSHKLDFDDLSGLIGAEPQDRPQAEKQGLFPDTPVATDRLHAINMDITFESREVIAPRLPLDQLRFRVRLSEGRAEADPLSFRIADGRITGEAALNVRQQVPSADADLTFEAVSLKPFFKHSQFVQEMGGEFSGHLYLLGVGDTLAKMLANSRGQGSISMRDGNISGLMVEAVGLDVAESLGLLVSDDVRVGIRCGRMDFDVEGGEARFTRFLMDTSDSLLVATGTLDLGKERYDIQVEAREKDFSLIDMTAPVHVAGAFDDPEVEIGGIDPFPFFKAGDQTDISCKELLSDATAQAHEDPGD